MGLERGPGFLRRPPRGWVPARAFALERELQAEDPDEGGSRGSVIDTSYRYRFLWEVRLDGREPVRFTEERRVPVWVHPDSPSGRRWYRPRLRASYGLMASLGVPVRVDPADPRRMWIDWDAAFDEHEQAWAQHKRSEPDRRAARDAAIQAEGERKAREMGFVPAAERGEQGLRMVRIRHLHRNGLKGKGVVVGQVDTGRTVGEHPLIEITIDVELRRGGGSRRVVYEHIWGADAAAKLPAGTRVRVALDPDDPTANELV